ncbi:NAD-dependent DNA ligase [Shrimp hemocyte iridescent virus]|uniref:DNA ligase (NAD(+)) n=1 Tax=Shrimp hemocyte iridescent virus TaxID=2039780 RepID=A0A291B0R3_9VIRU|nr:NAD-dependent DNA ligase [Shrimp hemocyte iridescent virus]ATE87074.1 NAD-dependent DNA ligase [Shrimp hemocyte iridescent virus]
MEQFRKQCDEHYENGNPIISDEDYDVMFGDESSHHELHYELNLSNKILKSMKLPVWLGSLDKKRDEKSLELWKLKTKKSFVISTKLDGISALYDVQNKKMYTRGNGSVGCDISKFCKYINLPKEISSDEEKIYIRGELIMANETFEKLYKDKFNNPRNLVSGQFGKKTVDKEILKHVDFIPYEIIYPERKLQDFPDVQMKSLMKSFSNVLIWKKVKSDKINYDNLSEILDDLVSKSKYAIDGLVITENIQYERNESGNPKYSVAFKKNNSVEDSVSSVVESVSWNISRWGLLKPIVNIKPVKISNVTISKCTGHNAKYIQENKIGPGAIITCVRSGDVIPYINKVVKPSDNISLPSNATWQGVDLKSNEENDESEIKTINNIFSKLGVKFVNLKTIEKLYRDCDLKSFFKIVKCTREDISKVFKEKSGDRILNEMNKLKENEIKVATLISSSGTLGYGVGEKRIEILFETIPYEKIPSLEQICKIEGFGKKLAEKILENYENMLEFISECKLNGLRLDIFANEISNESENPKKTKSTEMKSEKIKICLTGFRDDSLADKYIISNSLTKDCKYLVCKSVLKETTKMIKAEKLGIQIVSREEFLELNV